MFLRELYLGPLLGYTAFRTQTGDPGNQAILESLGTGASWTGQPFLGVAGQYDTRDSQYYPSRGVNSSLRLNGSLKSLPWRRVGLEGGVGAGKVFPSFAEFGPQKWLPGVWGSATYKLMEEQDMRARITLATSKSGGAFYFAVGQNF